MFKRLINNKIAEIKATDASIALQSSEAPFLLDVRQPEEFETMRIAGAVLIPMGELNARLTELPREREIICVCHSGSRSVFAARMLADMGFKVINLRGGMMAWERARLPVQSGA
jgi:rhodanese-related sulfurtransferase